MERREKDEEKKEEKAEGCDDDDTEGHDDDDDETAERSDDDVKEGIKEAKVGGDGQGEASDGYTEQNDGDGENDSVKKKVSTGRASVPGQKCLPGIIYLGHIPPRLRPKHLRNMLSSYGEVGRIFLQPEDHQVRRRKKKSGLRRCDFTEGWVEFRDKRVAKKVAASLHNTPMGTKKRQKYYSDLWCIKYLHRFQWTHLSERLAYEQTVLQQRLRTEVAQAKRETNFYLNNVDKSAHLEKLRKKRKPEGQQAEERTWDFTQRQTEEEIQLKKRKRERSSSQKHLEKNHVIQQKSQSNVSLLAKIFNSSVCD